MSASLWWLMALVLALIVGPLASLRAASHWRSRSPPPAVPGAPKRGVGAEKDSHKPGED